MVETKNTQHQSRKRKRKHTNTNVGNDGGHTMDVISKGKSTCCNTNTITTICNSSKSSAKLGDTSPNAHQPTDKRIQASDKLAAVSASTFASGSMIWKSSKKYVTIYDGPIYYEILQNAYIGFSYVPASQIPEMLMTVKPPPPILNKANYDNHYDYGYDTNKDFHLHYQNVLQSLYHYYQYDIIMPGGKHTSRTFVRRTLVGEPGMTYKYLGLRLFTHAWRSTSGTSSNIRDNHHDDNNTTTTKRDSNKVSPLFHNVYKLNQAMIQMTEHQLRIHQERTGRVVPQHLYDYNITLINYMEPCTDMKSHKYNSSTDSNKSLGGHHQKHQQLRDEEFYDMGKASVSWHADSSLQDYSCIGVYHTLFEDEIGDKAINMSHQKKGAEKGNNRTEEFDDNDWKIAIRPNPTTSTPNVGKRGHTGGGDRDKSAQKMHSNIAESPPPPIVVPTKSGDVYFLLDEFNHKFQHMVLAGSNHQNRISSTHRVAVTTTDTYQYVSKACSTALLSSKAELKKSQIHHWDTSILLKTQAVLDEVEFEWIAQYWIQGAQHDAQHTWWQKPIRALEDAWNALERVTYKIYTNIVTVLISAERDKIYSRLPSRSFIKSFLHTLQTRQEQRLKWDHRRADKIYKRRISVPYQPVERPMFQPNNTTNDSKQQQKQLPKDLSNAIQTLSDLLQKYPLKGG